MPMDMPPGAHATGLGADRVVEYRIPAAAASAMTDWVGAARAQDRQRLEAALFSRDGDARREGLPSSLDPERAAVRPQIDRHASSVSSAERAAMASVRSAADRGRADELGVVMPKGYVAERVRLFMRTARLEREGVDPMTSKAYVCSLAAVALDRRAGAHFHGGEVAAARARAAVPERWMRGCPEGGVLAVQASGLPTQRVPFDSAATRSTVHPASSRPAFVEPVSVSPKYAGPVRVDPAHSRIVRIDPVGSKRTRIDLGSLSKGPEAIDPSHASRARIGREI